jgi:hypothetical protein
VFWVTETSYPFSGSTAKFLPTFTIKELNDAVAIVSKKGFSRELTIEFQRVIFDFDLF